MEVTVTLREGNSSSIGCFFHSEFLLGEDAFLQPNWVLRPVPLRYEARSLV